LQTRRPGSDRSSRCGSEARGRGREGGGRASGGKGEGG
jgi:hypothetical protein